jgi:hypothetical protein
MAERHHWCDYMSCPKRVKEAKNHLHFRGQFVHNSEIDPQKCCGQRRQLFQQKLPAQTEAGLDVVHQHALFVVDSRSLVIQAVCRIRRQEDRKQQTIATCNPLKKPLNGIPAACGGHDY